MTREELVAFVKHCRTYYLATLDEGKPTLRPFGTFSLLEGNIHIQTGKKKAVYREMIANPAIAICAFDGTDWVRLQAKAVIEERVDFKAALLDEYPELKTMYSADDDNTALFRLDDIDGQFFSSDKTESFHF